MNSTNRDAIQLEGRGAVITGASRGLGEALAHALADAGAHVILIARGGEALDVVAQAIRGRGGRADTFAIDLSDRRAVGAIAAQAHALAGPIDMLVNNASALGPTPLRPLLDGEVGEFAELLAVNVLAPYQLARALGGPMALRGRGTIINISSDAAVEAYPGWGFYGASKAALDQLSRIWAEELASRGVRVLSIDPGEMNTRMHADAMPDADTASLARPADVAGQIVTMIRAPARATNGSRLVAAAFEVAS